MSPLDWSTLLTVLGQALVVVLFLVLLVAIVVATWRGVRGTTPPRRSCSACVSGYCPDHGVDRLA